MKTSYLIAGAAVLVALLYASTRGAGSTGQAIGGAAVDFVDGVLTGTVTGIGEVIGVPVTNETECERARREGRTWDASFACPAGTFIKHLFS